MLKVLYLPIGSQPGTVEGFKNIGCDICVYDFWSEFEVNRNHDAIKRRFLQFVEDYKPDLIHMQLQMSGCLSVDTLNHARRIVPNVIITNWSGDVRREPSGNFINISHGCDYSLLSNTGQLEMYAKSGCKNVKFWQTGYLEKSFYPKYKTEFKYDVAFSANTYSTSLFPSAGLRSDIAMALISKFKARAGIFGAGYPKNLNISRVEPHEINDIYNNSVCVLSVSNFNDISHYYSDRLLMCLPSGRPCISWNFPGYESYFAHGSDIIIVNNIPELIEQINVLKSDPEYANMIGRNGYLKALAEHTFTSKVMELMEIIGLKDKI